MLNINNIISFKGNTGLSRKNTQSYSINRLNFNNTKLRPLSKDTVSFGMGIRQERRYETTGVDYMFKSLYDNIELCKKIHTNGATAAQHLEGVLNDALEEYICKEENPEGIISNIRTRVKSPESIREKVADKFIRMVSSNPPKVFNPRNINDIKDNVKDIIGARVILNHGTQAETKQIIDKIIEKVNKGDLVIEKIENYEPEDCAEDLKYFSDDDLQRLKDAVNNQRKESGIDGEIEVIKQSKASGYMGLHLDVDLTNSVAGPLNAGYHGEVQIVGSDVLKLKEVEDLCYKLRDGVGVKSGSLLIRNPAYREFIDHFYRYYDSENKEIKNNFAEYTKRAYVWQRKLNNSPSTSVSKEEYHLPSIKECGMEGKLPPQLDFNVLSALKYHCDKIKDLNDNPEKHIV